MSFENLLDNLWLFDFEVTKYDWLLVLINYRTDEEIIFHNSIPNDIQNFIDIHQPILIGHNARYYDQYILKAILAGYTLEEIKEVNDYIINGGQGFEINFGYVEIPPIWDTIQDIVPQKSLKEIEGNLLLDITESSVDFKINHKWSKEEFEEMLHYCRADVKALRPLFEARYDYFKTKFDLSILSKIDPSINIGLTNAKLCAKFLEAKLVQRNDEREYEIPKTIDSKYIPKKILDFFNKIHDDKIPSDLLFKSKLEYDFHGMMSIFAWGGAHGAKPNFIFIQEEEPEMVVINADFASLYPHLLALLQYNFISRNIKDKNAYYNTLQRRLELKKQGKKNEQAPLKLILNTTYGCQNNKYNDLYDPKGARGTCITGQLLICELTERIYEIGEVELIQLNTDGLMVKLPRRKLDEYYKVCDEFVKKCGIELEYDIIYKIVQRDVNNYAMLYGDKNKPSIKAKGGCFSSLPKIEIQEDGALKTTYKPDFKSNSLSIVAEALLKKLLFDIPVEKTINECDELARFQNITHLGSSYEKMVQESDNGDIELQRNNRIYSGKVPSGTLIKVKSDGRRDSLPNCPVNPIVDNANRCTIEDINKEWYIELANTYVNDFLGVKRLEDYKKDELLELAKELNIDVDKKTKKDELIKIIKKFKKGDNKMATKQELEERLEKALVQNEELVKKGQENNNTISTDILENEKLCNVLLLKKINRFREEIRNIEFVLDKELPNNLGGGEYYGIDQFYNAVQTTALKVGLDFSFETVNVLSFEKDLVKPSGKLPIHVATVETLATLTDLDTGASKEYVTISQGSDTIDKAISGANTLAFRHWFYKNFTPKGVTEDDLDKVDDTPKSTPPKVPVYIPETKKEEIKKEVVAQVQQESTDDEDIKEICDNIMKIRAVGVDENGKDLSNYGAKTLEQIMSGTLSDADVMEIDLKIKNKMEKVGI